MQSVGCRIHPTQMPFNTCVCLLYILSSFCILIAACCKQHHAGQGVVHDTQTLDRRGGCRARQFGKQSQLGGAATQFLYLGPGSQTLLAAKTMQQRYASRLAGVCIEAEPICSVSYGLSPPLVACSERPSRRRQWRSIIQAPNGQTLPVVFLALHPSSSVVSLASLLGLWATF